MLSGFSGPRQVVSVWRTGLRILLTALLGVSSGAPAWACTAEYDSPESLLKNAQCVIEVEVLSVGNVPAPAPEPADPEGPQSRTSLTLGAFWDKPASDEDRRHAQAEVRVVDTLKGRSPVTKLTVVGGPYASCAPHAAYVHFEKGSRFFLILAEALKLETRMIVLGRRGCMQMGSAPEMRGLIATVGASWARMRDRHEKANPAAFARARDLVETARQGSLEEPEQEPYAVLACLRQLLADPSADGDQASFVEVDETPSSAPGQSEVIVAGNPRRLARLAMVEGALVKRREERPDEAVVFNRVLVTRLLINELMVPGDLVARLLPETRLNRRTQNALTDCDSPFTFVFWPANKDDPDYKVLQSLNVLLALAGDEPDRLVHSSFALGFGDHERSPFEPGLLAPYLAAHVKSVALDDWGRLQVLLLLPHPAVASIVTKALEDELNSSRMDKYARFFAWLDDVRGFAAVVDRFLVMATAEVERSETSERQNTGSQLAFTARRIGALAKRSDAAWSVAKARTDAFARDYPDEE
ncbi:MAG: hypothetical protein IPL39_02370 [Opitutaceae bacterium]|nr:hypothetical protein [Opitutaceae bacterium]